MGKKAKASRELTTELKHKLYEKSVQNHMADIEFIEEEFEKLCIKIKAMVHRKATAQVVIRQLEEKLEIALRSNADAENREGIQAEKETDEGRPTIITTPDREQGSQSSLSSSNSSSGGSRISVSQYNRLK